MFDSVQVRFKDTKHRPSPFSNTREVPFVGDYLTVLKSVVNDIKTEYFWFFANFMDLKTIDLDYIPEQHEAKQIHVWYNTHPLGGTNKEGNVLLIPTAEFKKQCHSLKFLRDYKEINYHAHPNLFQNWVQKVSFELKNPLEAYKSSEPTYYKWLYNKDIDQKRLPNFFPSFWDDVKLYTWGQTKDIMLVPHKDDIKNFYDFDRIVDFDMQYDIKPMDIVFMSYDEPNADQNWEKLKTKYPRAKRVHGVSPRTFAYMTAANMSETDYFFAVFPTIDIDDSFDFTFQPDRLKEPCHYIFHCKNPVNGLEYGHRAVILYNKWLCLTTVNTGLDYTLSQPHTVIPKLCGTTNFNTTPEISWRVAFREVIKLCAMKPTVESRYRLKKWCELGTGQYALLVQRGALDAVDYYEQNKDDHNALMLSYELDWLKDKFNSIS